MERTYALAPGLAVAATLILLGLQLTGGIFLGSYLLLRGTDAFESFSLTWLFAIIFALSLVATTRLTCSFGRASWRNPHLLLPRQPISLATWLASVPLLAGNAVVILSLTAWLFHGLLSNLPGNPLLESVLDFEGQPWAVSFLAVVLAPVGEEILFRAVILAGLLRTLRPRSAIVLSAVLFAAAHANLAQLPVSLVLGLTLGWIFVRTRSIGLCITLHLLHNAIFVYGWAWPSFWPGLSFPAPTAEPTAAPVEVLLLGVIASSVGLLAIHRFTRGSRPDWSRTEAMPPLLAQPPLLARE
ncbi:MAG TPA: type II CAAX endopeptidase family protein [Opitutaceae bacterium]|nr:type II CAAX endopeptidase family protein [Opitutaceae bacterium]HRJ48707.1 type II CAAX endopeptidase family protein [Opitutaceae bacterium]